MRKAFRLLPLMLLMAFAPLTITKTSAVVSDPQGNLLPKRVPGSLVDYTVTISNPNGALTTVNGVTFADAIPANTVLRVGDLGLLPGSGPIVYTDGLSLLSYSFTSLGSSTDRLDFSNDHGATWTYTPSGEFDANVTNIRVRMGGNQVAGSSFTLRFRVKVK
ncbi:hypothetical protein [Sphingomonas sp. G-3-2-10]|uniref:hypothetical protein n=1 Tax=Sphingomonas sp. G-3-2-10 TaxID=2728838 RepID=UPI00146A2797|nr:hypothetical protein [Sphingomonas sp. G-3-2-10]NML05160.1 hypothetical protein [Sphingomonas sp. G-3-2-10]